MGLRAQQVGQGRNWDSPHSRPHSRVHSRPHSTAQCRTARIKGRGGAAELSVEGTPRGVQRLPAPTQQGRVQGKHWQGVNAGWNKERSGRAAEPALTSAPTVATTAIPATAVCRERREAGSNEHGSR